MRKGSREREARSQKGREKSRSQFWLLATGFWLLSLPAFSQTNDSKIWTGVYTAEQAERGKVNFTGSCTRCHLGDLSGGIGPSLQGERFIKAWENENLYRLFVKIRDTMPPNFGTALTEEGKLDVIAYLLQVNGFPSGSADLKVDTDALEGVQIVKKEADTAVPNFTLVQVVGCLTPGPDNIWQLTRTTEPVVTKDQSSTADELEAADSQPLGSQTFRLVSTGTFKSALQDGRKVQAKGLLYREPAESRLNLTSLQTIGPGCR
jgi:S-disulfanyl-L-cysteine oxidoreductase SoxD